MIVFRLSAFVMTSTIYLNVLYNEARVTEKAVMCNMLNQ